VVEDIKVYEFCWEFNSIFSSERILKID